MRVLHGPLLLLDLKPRRADPLLRLDHPRSTGHPRLVRRRGIDLETLLLPGLLLGRRLRLRQGQVRLLDLQLGRGRVRAHRGKVHLGLLHIEGGLPLVQRPLSQTAVHVLKVPGRLTPRGGQLLLGLAGGPLGFAEAPLRVPDAPLGVGEGPLGVLHLPGRCGGCCGLCGGVRERRLDGVTDTRHADLDRSEGGAEGEDRRGGKGGERPELGQGGAEGGDRGEGREDRPADEEDLLREPAEAAAAVACAAAEGSEGGGEGSDPEEPGADVDGAVAGEVAQGVVGRGCVCSGGDAGDASTGQVRQVVRSNPSVYIHPEADPLALTESTDLARGDPGVDGGPDLDEPVRGELIEGLLGLLERRLVDLRDDVGGGLPKPIQFGLGGGVIELGDDPHGALVDEAGDPRSCRPVIQLGQNPDGPLVDEPADADPGRPVIQLGPDGHRAIPGHPGQAGGDGLVVQLGSDLDGAGLGELGELRLGDRRHQVDTDPDGGGGGGELPLDPVKDLLPSNLPGHFGWLADGGGQLDAEPAAELSCVGYE
ncbi:hypothetical protein [Streptomyces sp. CYG20]|uniref:hypothetical protein n=1 Tax=Streptomyces sp. CYG20 TaxID=2838873 RepID=UPI00203706FF|nr:hypothetical protein [Streptomyces sp. CYG20]